MVEALNRFQHFRPCHTGAPAKAGSFVLGRYKLQTAGLYLRGFVISVVSRKGDQQATLR